MQRVSNGVDPRGFHHILTRCVLLGILNMDVDIEGESEQQNQYIRLLADTAFLSHKQMTISEIMNRHPHFRRELQKFVADAFLYAVETTLFDDGKEMDVVIINFEPPTRHIWAYKKIEGQWQLNVVLNIEPSPLNLTHEIPVADMDDPFKIHELVTALNSFRHQWIG